MVMWPACKSSESVCLPPSTGYLSSEAPARPAALAGGVQAWYSLNALNPYSRAVLRNTWTHPARTCVVRGAATRLGGGAAATAHERRPLLQRLPAAIVSFTQHGPLVARPGRASRPLQALLGLWAWAAGAKALGGPVPCCVKVQQPSPTRYSAAQGPGDAGRARPALVALMPLLGAPSGLFSRH